MKLRSNQGFPTHGVTLFLLLVAPALVFAAPVEYPNPNNGIVFSLGYSFGWANASTPEPTDALLGETSGNEPLIGISVEYGRHRRVLWDFKLALANFGRLIETPGADEVLPPDVDLDTTATDTAPDVRRSVIADASVRFRFTKLDKDATLAGFLTLNAGFILDAQSEDTGTQVDDASSYLFLGPSLVGRFDGTEFLVDLLFGQSEVMTNTELFSEKFDTDTFRIKPRFRLALLEPSEDEDEESSDNRGKNNEFDLRPLILGLWCDLGTSDKTGDTYVLFISKPIWGAGSD